MTKINRLKLYGFKSFAKPTELEFGNDFNCILGPNGSGKSNIVDAICFVLGRSSTKALRAEKSANLIYNGGKIKKPAKQAEVSIFFDNSSKVFPTQEPEVKITRIVRQNGVSVYKINDEIRTRQQILELMSLAKVDPEGYNIILQGDIIRFVEMSPLDRRKLIEEISGISKYEEKKEKAVRELDRVEVRLKEAEIILIERETHLKELKKERDQAQKYKDLNNRITVNKATFLYRQIEKKQGEKEELEKQFGKHDEKLKSLQAEISDLKKEIADRKAQIESINNEIEQKGEKEQVEIHKFVEQLKVDLATSKNRVETCKTEINKIAQRKEQLKQSLKEIEDKIASLNEENNKLNENVSKKEKEQNIINSKIEEFKKRNKLDSIGDIDKQIDDLDKSAEQIQKDVQDSRTKQQDFLRQKDKLEFQIQTLDERIDKVLSVEKENKSQIQDLKQKKQEFKKASLELNTCLNKDSSLAVQLSNAQSNLAKLNEDLVKLNARNLSIQENLSKDLALKKILELKKKNQAIYGTVSELGRVQSKYSLALDVAAGSRVKNVVVKDDQTAASCIKYLKDNKLGIVTFLPINKVKAPNTPSVASLKSTSGVHGTALDLITYDSKFNSIFSYVFGNTLIVENIPVARRIGIGKARMVTLDGDITELSGAMSGGFRKKRTGAFQEKELTKDILKLEKDIADIASIVSRLEENRADNEEQINKLRQIKASLEGEIIKLEKMLNLESGDVDVSKKQKAKLKQEIDEVNDKINQVQSKVTSNNKDLANNKIKRQELRTRINELRDPTLLAELNAFEQKKQELREEIIQVNSDKKNIEAQIINILNPENDRILQILKQHTKEEEAFASESKRLSSTISDNEKLLKTKEKEQKQFYERFKDLFGKRSKLNDEIVKREAKVEAVSQDVRTVELKINTVNIDMAKVKAEFAGLNMEFEQYKDTEIDKDKPDSQLKKEIAQFENMVQNLGSVNLKALEIYEGVEVEYNNLLGKKDKLIKEKEDVLIMMNEIDTKKKQIFLTNFDTINQHFSGIFSQLSSKGEAFLELENPETPLEEGVRVKVRLTGNKFLDIRSLSGGEKTLTALAFIFCIQEYEPASFYILDEVDAALDKKNSERLAAWIKKYTGKAQYVVISHNDHIVSSADTLYGVSMNEHGMSNLVSLKL